jgi:hypothetical protein
VADELVCFQCAVHRCICDSISESNASNIYAIFPHINVHIFIKATYRRKVSLRFSMICKKTEPFGAKAYDPKSDSCMSAITTVRMLLSGLSMGQEQGVKMKTPISPYKITKNHAIIAMGSAGRLLRWRKTGVFGKQLASSSCLMVIVCIRWDSPLLSYILEKLIRFSYSIFVLPRKRNLNHARSCGSVIFMLFSVSRDCSELEKNCL